MLSSPILLSQSSSCLAFILSSPINKYHILLPNLCLITLIFLIKFYFKNVCLCFRGGGLYFRPPPLRMWDFIVLLAGGGGNWERWRRKDSKPGHFVSGTEQESRKRLHMVELTKNSQRHGKCIWIKWTSFGAHPHLRILKGGVHYYEPNARSNL